jgi:hypothetical protein
MKNVYERGPTGSKLSIYLANWVSDEISQVSDYMGISVSKLIQQAWQVARTYKGDHIPGSIFPLPPGALSPKESNADVPKKNQNG